MAPLTVVHNQDQRFFRVLGDRMNRLRTRLRMPRVAAVLTLMGVFPPSTVLLALIIIGLAVLYRFGPSRREPRWQ